MKTKSPKWSRFENSVRALAARIKVDRSTLARHLSMPGAPKKGGRGYDVESVLVYMLEGSKDPRTAELRAEELSLKIEAQKFKLARERDQLWLPRDKTLAAIENIASEMKSTLYKRFDELPPKLQGLDVLAMRERLRAVADEVCLQVQSRQTPWTVKQDQTAQPQTVTR